jgi:hypothetical protein
VPKSDGGAEVVDLGATDVDVATDDGGTDGLV